jgi:hypothetical protein
VDTAGRGSLGGGGGDSEEEDDDDDAAAEVDTDAIFVVLQGIRLPENENADDRTAKVQSKAAVVVLLLDTTPTTRPPLLTVPPPPLRIILYACIGLLSLSFDAQYGSIEGVWRNKVGISMNNVQVGWVIGTTVWSVHHGMNKILLLPLS